MKDNGRNPILWDCNKNGCYNIKHRPKIEVFADCFSGKINFGDLDASIVEINSRALLLEWKSTRGDVPTGQDLTYKNLSRTGLLVAAVLVGNAETMVVTQYGFYIGGQFTGWKESDLNTVKKIFTRWEQRARSLPKVVLRKALPHERISKAEIDEWVADYTAHQHEFDDFALGGTTTTAARVA